MCLPRRPLHTDLLTERNLLILCTAESKDLFSVPRITQMMIQTGSGLSVMDIFKVWWTFSKLMAPKHLCHSHACVICYTFKSMVLGYCEGIRLLYSHLSLSKKKKKRKGCYCPQLPMAERREERVSWTERKPHTPYLPLRFKGRLSILRCFAGEVFPYFSWENMAQKTLFKKCTKQGG